MYALQTKDQGLSHFPGRIIQGYLFKPSETHNPDGAYACFHPLRAI